MKRVKVYTNSYIDQLDQRLQNKDVVSLYIDGKSPVCTDADMKDTILEIESFPNLSVDKKEFENAQILYEAFEGMNLTLASDLRLWAWLAHVPFMDYMSKRWPVGEQEETKRPGYVARHWFVKSQTSGSYMDHGIAMLWWGAHVTHDLERDNPFELTKELFSMLDYTTTIFGELGRSSNFIHAVLEFVIENPELFKSQKEAKVRFIMRKMNYVGGYKILSNLPKNDIKNLLEQYRTAIEVITKK